MDTSSITTTELLAILDVTRRLAERRMVQPLMEYVAATVFELIAAERCLIVLFDDCGTLNVLIARNRQGQAIGDANDQVSHSILQRVRTTMTPLLINDALSDKALKTSMSVRALGLRSVMCVPLVSYGQSIGAIYVENRSARGKFREESLVPLVLFSNQVVVALENARIYEALEARITERTQALQAANTQLAQQASELREQSIRDSLTELYNRRHFTAILPQLFEAARRYQRPLALACADIDNFKQINDTFYHEGGDRVLMKMAQILRESVRAADNIARIGGEEFAIIMPETPLPAALNACERLRTTIEQYDWDSLAPGLKVTISIGIAEDVDCIDAQELLRRADTRLYMAKRVGKNRVVAVEVAHPI